MQNFDIMCLVLMANPIINWSFLLLLFLIIIIFIRFSSGTVKAPEPF